MWLFCMSQTSKYAPQGPLRPWDLDPAQVSSREWSIVRFKRRLSAQLSHCYFSSRFLQTVGVIVTVEGDAQEENPTKASLKSLDLVLCGLKEALAGILVL